MAARNVGSKMNRPCIVGVGLVSASGWNLGTTARSIMRGQSSRSPLPPAIKQHVRPEYGHRIPWFQDADPYQRLKLLAFKAADQAKKKLPMSENIDLVCVGSTSAGFSSSEQGIFQEPGALGEALRWRYKAESMYQFSQACAASGYAIAAAADHIRLGESEIALAGGADELTCCVISAFDACRIYADECKPFDKDRKGVVLGEAAAFLIMMSEELAIKCGMKPKAFITGIGLNCDAYDAAAPLDTGIAETIKQACEYEEYPVFKGLPDLVIAHGTGTKLNDEVESRAIRSVFGEQSPPVMSYKGALGHPQGASGAVSVALATWCLNHQTMLPSVGLKEQDPELEIITVIRPIELRDGCLESILCLSYGSWGANSAIMISRT
jgi:3-oxoacyl-(acyl-carrier-protein) synthase